MASYSASITSSSSNLLWTTTNSNDWTTGEACQGAYQSSYSRVGQLYFPNLASTVAGYVITQIEIKFNCTASGGTSNKTLKMVTSAYQTKTTAKSGSQVIYGRSSLGNVVGNFYNNSPSFTFNKTTNSVTFQNLCSYILSGNNVIVIYNGESSSSSSYSSSYLKMTSVTMKITYADVYVSNMNYYDGNSWRLVIPYYFDGTSWRKCNSYYNDGTAWRGM